MKLSQFLLISVQSVLFVIVAILSTTTTPVESTTLIFRRSHVKEKTIHVGNVISSPMVRCREGYHLDHRRKCRPIVGTFFPSRRPKWVFVNSKFKEIFVSFAKLPFYIIVCALHKLSKSSRHTVTHVHWPLTKNCFYQKFTHVLKWLKYSPAHGFFLSHSIV